MQFLCIFQTVNACDVMAALVLNVCTTGAVTHRDWVCLCTHEAAHYTSLKLSCDA